MNVLILIKSDWIVIQTKNDCNKNFRRVTALLSHRLRQIKMAIQFFERV